ncbi:MAG: hypothetical protein RL557_341 [archaeon]|jgi:ribosomal protein S18 acetylase RimI-like enzyme
MILRKAEINDTEGIGEVLRQSYNIQSTEEGMQVFEDEMRKGSHYIVAFEDSKIAGIASWVVRGLLKHQLAELDRIAVLPEYKGKGIAVELFEYLKKDAQEFYLSKGFTLRKVYLCVHATNARAQQFYKKIGFSHEASLPSHYYDGVDEYVFSMFLK